MPKAVAIGRARDVAEAFHDLSSVQDRVSRRTKLKAVPVPALIDRLQQDLTALGDGSSRSVPGIHSPPERATKRGATPRALGPHALLMSCRRPNCIFWIRRSTWSAVAGHNAS